MRLGLGIGLGRVSAMGSIGGLSQTADDATLSATGRVLIAGALAILLADATMVGTAQARITGTMSVVSEDSTGASTGSHSIQGTAAITGADATVVGIGVVKVQGTAASTGADATVAGAGMVKVQGTASSTGADATVAGAGAVKVQGTSAVSSDAATLSSAGAVKVQGALAVTLADATLVAAGAVTNSELFPDPTLTGTGNSALWSVNGDLTFAPANAGAGPDIFVNSADGDNGDGMQLGGAYETALLSAWAASTTKTVQLTAANLSVSGSVFALSRGGTEVEFAFAANGTVSHSVTAGADIEVSFKIKAPSGGDGGVFEIAAISVT